MYKHSSVRVFLADDMVWPLCPMPAICVEVLDEEQSEEDYTELKLLEAVSLKEIKDRMWLLSAGMSGKVSDFLEKPSVLLTETMFVDGVEERELVADIKKGRQWALCLRTIFYDRVWVIEKGLVNEFIKVPLAGRA